MIRPITRKDYVRSFFVGLLMMIVGLIATAIILVTILAVSKRELAVGPLYLAIPIVAFAAGFSRSLMRLSRPKIHIRPPSIVAVVVKSALVGFAGVLVSLICYVVWIWLRVPRNFHGLVGIDLSRAVNWFVGLGIFLTGFLLEYRRASRRRSTWSSGEFR